MRIKGVNAFEQNVEKIVVGVAGLTLVGVLVWQLVLLKNTVKVGAKDDIPLHEAVDVVAGEARAVESRVTDPSPNIETKSEPDPLELFVAAYKGPVAPHPDLAIGIGSSLSGMGGGTVDGPGPIEGPIDAPYTALAFPAPSAPIARAWMGTLDPRGEIEDSPELAELLPKVAETEPLDAAIVSVEATVSGKAVLAALGADSDGEGPIRPLPRHWWESSTAILMVQLVREERQPDGAWSNQTFVDPLPSRISLKDEIDNGPINSIAEMIKRANENANDIQRPDFLPVLYGVEWVPPSEVPDDTAVSAAGTEIDKSLRQLRDKERHRESLEQKLQEAQNPQPKGEPKPGRGGGGGGGGGTRGGGKGGGAKGGGGGGGGSGGAPPGPDETKIRQIERAIERVDAEIEQLRQKLADLGYKDEGQDATPDKPLSDPQKKVPFLQSESVRVWAHDVTAVRGKTYRYSVRLWMTNPYYGNSASLPGEQAALAKPVSLASADSAWSEPVEVPADKYYFITSASDDTTLGSGPRATAELYVFRWAYWRKEATLLEPGDAIGTNISVPDLAEMLRDPQDQDANPRPDNQPGGPKLPGGPKMPGSPGGGLQPGGKPRGVDDGGRDQVPGQNQDPKDALPPPVKMADMPVAFSVVLLDVASVPVADRGAGEAMKVVSKAYLKDEEGRVVGRLPEAERKGRLYARLSSSAELGEQALKRPLHPNDPVDRPPPPGRGPGAPAGPIPAGGKGGQGVQ